MKSSKTKKKDELYNKYRERLLLEYEFNILKCNFDYVIRICKRYPHFVPYYAPWLHHTRIVINEYEDLLDKCSNVSFSTVYGFQKDEEIITVYRHPFFQRQINNHKKHHSHHQPHQHSRIQRQFIIGPPKPHVFYYPMRYI